DEVNERLSELLTLLKMAHTTQVPEEDQLTEEMVFGSIHKSCIATYCVLLVVSAFGNITVLVNILKRRRNLRFGNNYMFMHLAIADLLVTFLMMPLEIGWNATVSWKAGDAACRIMSFFRIFGLYLSSFVMVCISLDRCFAILRPMSNVVNVAKRSRIMLSIAWSLATLCSLPQVFIFHVQQHPKFPWYEQCLDFDFFPTHLHQFWYRVLGMLLMYGMPLLVIVISYACIITEIFRRYQLSPDDSFRRSSLVFLNRARNRTLKMAIIIFVVFFICWTPYYVMSLWYWIDKQSAEKVDLRIRKGLFLFACTNSCMNPIVYGYFNFRSGRGSGNGAPRPGQQLQHPQTVGINSRRGSNCSSIYRDNSNQSMHWNRRNSRETELHANNNRDENHLHPNHSVRTTSTVIHITV
ncbi:hypothetical protein L9F63_006131, partial [Diploptera punctata]